MGVTDYFDGYLARSSGAVSKLGVFLDPIADKIMVAAVILVLTAQGILRGPYVGDAHVIAGLIILVREIAVSGLREFLGGLQVSVPVSKLAKWKTTFQLVALGALILGGAARVFGPILGGILFYVGFRFFDVLVSELERNDIIPQSVMDSIQSGTVRFMFVGLSLMLLMIFRPQGILGNRKELELDAR